MCVQAWRTQLKVPFRCTAMTPADAAARASDDRDAAGEHVCHECDLPRIPRRRMLHRARGSGRGVRSSGSLPPPMLLSEHDRPTALHYRILALTWAGWLFDFYDLILYTFLLDPISRELGLARAAHAVLLGASLGATALGGALFGYLADRHGRRAVLQWSILTYSAGTVLCGLAPGIATRRAPGRRAARAGLPPPRGRRLRPRRPQHVVVLVHLHLAADVPDGGARALDRGLGLEDPGRRAGRAARLRLLRLGVGPVRTKAGLQPLRDPHGRGAGLDHAPLAGDRRVAAPPPPLPRAGRLRHGDVVQLRPHVRRAVPDPAAHDGRRLRVQRRPRRAVRGTACRRGHGASLRARRRDRARRRLRPGGRRLGLAAARDARATDGSMMSAPRSVTRDCRARERGHRLRFDSAPWDTGPGATDPCGAS